MGGVNQSSDPTGREKIFSLAYGQFEARYSSLPPRVAALRVKSRETVEGLRPMRRAISRTPTSWAQRSTISSRSANDRHLPEMGFDMNNGIPLRCRNQREPTTGDSPTASAAFSLVIPVAFCTQNSLSISRRCEGAPGECSASLPVNCFIHPAGLPINTSWLEVLRRPVESAQFTSEEFTGMLEANNIAISMDGKGRWMDNVFIERLWRSVKYEHVYLHSYDSIADLRQGLKTYFGFFNQGRTHQSLARQTPNEVYFAPRLRKAA